MSSTTCCIEHPPGMPAGVPFPPGACIWGDQQGAQGHSPDHTSPEFATTVAVSGARRPFAIHTSACLHLLTHTHTHILSLIKCMYTGHMLLAVRLRILYMCAQLYPSGKTHYICIDAMGLAWRCVLCRVKHRGGGVPLGDADADPFMSHPSWCSPWCLPLPFTRTPLYPQGMDQHAAGEHH